MTLPVPAPEVLPAPVIDTHCHLDIITDYSGLTAERALRAAASVGVTGVVQVAVDIGSAHRSIELAHAYRNVVAAVAIHPNEAPVRAASGHLGADLDKLAGLAADPLVKAIGETGLDFYRTDESGREAQEASFRAHIRMAREHGKALVIHDRDAHDDVLRVLAEEDLPPQVVFHCFSGDADMARYCTDRGWYLSFAGVVTFKNAPEVRDALRVTPRDRILFETDAPFLTPVPHRGKANASYLLPLTVRAAADVLDVPVTEMCADSRHNSLRAFDLGEDFGNRLVTLLGPAEITSLAAGLALHPAKSRGQNFVIDPNTIRRLVRLAELPPDSHVLEIGPGLGSLTLGLLEGGHRVTAVELDDRLAARLATTVGEHLPGAGSRLRVLHQDGGTLTTRQAEPTALVANLPYNVAVPVLLHCLATFPGITRTLVMVQAEVADRLAAQPGSRVYGGPSVKVRWYGRPHRVGSVPPQVFWPVPRVDSGLVAIDAVAPPGGPVSRDAAFAVIDRAFGQRRKMLRASLASQYGTERAAAALAAAGLDGTMRPERLELADFIRLTAAIALVRD